MLRITIVGGGLAGLTCAILLQKAGFAVKLFEKKRYPFHRVCGEYISNEALPFIESLGVDVQAMNPSRISRLCITSASGKELTTGLDLGGFGLSRYVLDHSLFELASQLGVEFLFQKVNDLYFEGGYFTASSESGLHESDIAIAAYGKRSNLDQKLKRNFFYKRSPYLGVKYHILTDLPAEEIRLDNFPGGYSGLCHIGDGKYNLCYLSETANLKRYGAIACMEQEVLFKNSRLRSLFKNSDFLFDKPEVINEISFENKSLAENHLLFCGDAAGMITPLCGNGMAMAFRSAKILSGIILDFAKKPAERNALEAEYKKRWTCEFSLRLKTGRTIQSLVTNRYVSTASIEILRKFPGLTRMLVKKTHGTTFMY